MTLEEFESEVNGNIEWMKETISFPPDSTGNKDEDYDNVLNDLSDMEHNEVYEVHVDFHLTNGEVIKTRNRCLESYYKRTYMGDDVCLAGGWLLANFKSEDGMYHQTRIKPESVCWIDAYGEDVDWKSNEKTILRQLGLN